jgi:protein TonB
MTAAQARRRPSVPTPIPAVYVAERGPEPSRAVVPVVGVMSLLAHGAVLAIFAALPPPPAHAGLTSEPLVLVPFEAEPVAIAEPPPEPIVEEVIEPPPEPAAAIVERPRPRPASVQREEAPDPAPAPPAEVLTTAGTGGAGDWSHTAGEPGGQVGGEVGGTGDGAGPAPVVDAAPSEPGISRAQLRRLLAGYITGTLSRYLDGRIEYPLAARREQLQGVVMLRIRLASDGRVLAVRLSRSCGHALLDRAALASVQGLGSMPAPPREIPWDDEQELPLPVTYVLQ